MDSDDSVSGLVGSSSVCFAALTAASSAAACRESEWGEEEREVRMETRGVREGADGGGCGGGESDVSVFIVSISISSVLVFHYAASLCADEPANSRLKPKQDKKE